MTLTNLQAGTLFETTWNRSFTISCKRKMHTISFAKKRSTIILNFSRHKMKRDSFQSGLKNILKENLGLHAANKQRQYYFEVRTVLFWFERCQMCQRISHLHACMLFRIFVIWRRFNKLFDLASSHNTYAQSSKLHFKMLFSL